MWISILATLQSLKRAVDKTIKSVYHPVFIRKHTPPPSFLAKNSGDDWSEALKRRSLATSRWWGSLETFNGFYEVWVKGVSVGQLLFLFAHLRNMTRHRGRELFVISYSCTDGGINVRKRLVLHVNSSCQSHQLLSTVKRTYMDLSHDRQHTSYNEDSPIMMSPRVAGVVLTKCNDYNVVKLHNDNNRHECRQSMRHEKTEILNDLSSNYRPFCRSQRIHL